MEKQDHSNATAIADSELILRTRSGDRRAFGELWRRHSPSGKSVARSITSSIDPDDLVQESYTRIYQAIIKGGGPNGSFRAYLFTSIRNTAAAWGRSRREATIDELESVADPDSTAEAADETLDRDLAAQAFRNLPARWQEVLWYSEIEQMKPAEIAPLLGMKAGAVSQLAFRAREGLREAWIQAHLRTAEPDSECGWTIEHLGAYSRGNLRARDQKRVDQHIDSCARCMAVAAEAKDVSARLALVLLPLVLGVTGAAGYAATLHGTMPVVAAAAIPSGVFESSSMVADGNVGAAAQIAPLDGGTSGSMIGGSNGAGSTGNGVAGGAITGIGALVGAGSAALIVAGVVAAATIVPGLINAPAATSLPNASDIDNSSISSEVEPDPDADADDKFVLEIDTEESAPPARDDEAPDTKGSIGDDTPEAGLIPPVTTMPSEGGAAVSEPSKPPVGPEKPIDPIDPGDGGEGDQDGGGDTTDPTLPDAPVDVVKTSICMNAALETVVSVELAGFVGAEVQPFIDGATDGTRRTRIDAEGNATATLKPTLPQILSNAPVDFRYTTQGTEFPRSTSLRELDVTALTAASAPACEPSSENLTEPAPTDSADVALGQQPTEVAALSAEQPPAAQPVEQPVVEPTPEQLSLEEPLPVASEDPTTGEELTPTEEGTAPAE